MQGANFLSQTETIPLLSRVTIFMGVGPEELHRLADKCVISNHKPDEIIIEQNSSNKTLYMIIRGSVQVCLKTPSMEWKQIKILGPGNVFGEISILRNVPTTARIKTLTSCRCLTISAKDFLEAYKYFPPRARDNIQIIVAKRLQELGRFVRI